MRRVDERAIRTTTEAGWEVSEKKHIYLHRQKDKGWVTSRWYIPQVGQVHKPDVLFSRRFSILYHFRAVDISHRVECGQRFLGDREGRSRAIPLYLAQQQRFLSEARFFSDCDALCQDDEMGKYVDLTPRTASGQRRQERRVAPIA